MFLLINLSLFDLKVRLDLNKVPRLISYNLIGDDFLLNVARWLNLNFNLKFKLIYDSNFRYEMDCPLVPFQRVYQSGLCISGQTIRGAANRILQLPRDEDVIINVGSVDLLHGRNLYDMYEDFIFLERCCLLRDINPIMTTLVPIANQMHNKALQLKLLVFNDKIRNCGFDYIDLYDCMVRDGSLMMSCFKRETNKVSGSTQPHLLWNKLGRQLALKFLQTHLMNLLNC